MTDIREMTDVRELDPVELAEVMGGYDGYCGTTVPLPIPIIVNPGPTWPPSPC
jgi:hypothetical protein